MHCRRWLGAAALIGGERTLTLASAVDINSFAPADSRDAHYVQYYQPVYDTLLSITPMETTNPTSRPNGPGATTA